MAKARHAPDGESRRMKTDLRHNQDVLTGLLFTGTGLGAVIVAVKYYPIGTSLQMGPGYFPTALGGILTLFGLYFLARGLRTGERIAGVWGLRPLVLITLGIVAFSIVIERFGLVPALFALFFIGALGGREFKFKEVLVLSVVMTVACWAIFIYGLEQPFRLFIWGR
jgi:hypothetical protein